MAKPKFYKNEYAVGRGFPWVGDEDDASNVGAGTGAAVDLGRAGDSNGLKLEVADTTSSRTYISMSSPCPAGVWCAVLIEIVDFDLANYASDSNSNAPIKNATTTNLNADTAPGDRIITFNDIINGGAGWYCIWMKYDVTSAAPTIRCGFGNDSGMTNGAGYITIGRTGFFKLQQENQEPSTSAFVPSFALPGYSNSYDVTGNKVNEYNRVTWGAESIGDIDRYSVIYAIGDSKSNSLGSDTPTTLPDRTPLSCYVYAEASQGYDFMVTNIADLQALKVRDDSNGVTDIWANMDEFPQAPLRPNCLMFSNFFVNDINSGDYTAQECVNNANTMANALGFDDGILTDMNPWKAGGAGHVDDQGTADPTKLSETLSFNALAKQSARDNGWPFVPLFYGLGKKLPGDTEIMADGADGDPDYTSDGLHPLGSAAPVIDGLIKTAIEEFNQRGNS